MSNITELKERYNGFYDYMAQSRDPKNMKVFGSVMTEMMDVMLAKMPAEAEEMIDKLEAIKWKQYLTPKEAEKIVAGMMPKGPWSRDTWKGAMESLGLTTEEQPAYNRCALWVEMSKMYSNFGEDIADMMGIALSPSSDEMIRACHRLAMKTLKDKDGVYDIRRYFGL